MEITRTITKKYHIEFYPNAFDCTVGDFIRQLERMGISHKDLKLVLYVAAGWQWTENRL